MTVVETGILLSISITSLVHLTRMGLLAEFLNKSKSLLGIAAGLGLASPSSDQKLISMFGYFGPRGLCVMVVSGAQFRSGLTTTYVWLPEKVKCG